jgi:hypothetical protein
MDKTLTDILGSDVLPAELLATLQEAFDAKVSEVRAEVEESVRSELAQRYEHDKNHLVEAMDCAITDVIKSYESQKSAELDKLREAHESVKTALAEGRSTYRKRINEQLTSANTFIATQLAEEVKALRAERKSLAEARVAAANEVNVLKTKLSEAHNTHVKKIDEFVVKQLGRELEEFDLDRKALVETRIKLVTENRRRLKETQERFIKESARKLDRHVSEQLTREMGQIHEDLERNRQNHFGRKIFESFISEFMSSYFADSTEAKKLQNILESQKAELETSKARLMEAEKASEAAVRKARLAEDRSERAKIMSELLAPLRGEKRAVMEGMLDSTPTAQLRKSFERLLPVVAESAPARKMQSQTARVLSETKAQPAAVVTGDQRNNRLVESIQATDPEIEANIAQVVRLAGIQKN